MSSIITTSGLFSCSFNFSPRTKWILQNLANYQGHNQTSVHQMHRALYPAVLLQLHLQNTAYVNFHGQQALEILSIGIQACSRSKSVCSAFNIFMFFTSPHFSTELLVSLKYWEGNSRWFFTTGDLVSSYGKEKKMSFISFCIFVLNFYFSLRKYHNQSIQKNSLFFLWSWWKSCIVAEENWGEHFS